MFEKIDFFETVEALQAGIYDGSYLLLVGEKTDISALSLSSSISMAGAIFPRIIFGTKSYQKGIIAARLSAQMSMKVTTQMESATILDIPKSINSLFVIVDGFSSKFDQFLENLFSMLPAQTKIIGGGAGKLTLAQEPVIFDAQGIYQDSAIIIYSKTPIGIGVEHGWESLVGPFIATKCEGHRLFEMNFKDAFLVYKEALERHSGQTIDEKNFFKIAQMYPLGIVRYNKEFIVREAIQTDGKSLLLVGNIDQNSVITILQGEKQKLITAAYRAAQSSHKHMQGKNSTILVIDCISRFLLLQDDFSLELETIASAYPKDAVIWGVLALGEIANANQEGIEFYNKTCVVGSLPCN